MNQFKMLHHDKVEEQLPAATILEARIVLMMQNMTHYEALACASVVI